jgi:two-component system, chemotaxis family, chemotaxis protein CheY
MKILLVDDSNTMRRIEKNTLEKMGYTDIHEASDGAEAIAKLGAGGFEPVMMDWNMPNGVKPFQPEILQEKISAVAGKRAA